MCDPDHIPLARLLAGCTCTKVPSVRGNTIKKKFLVLVAVAFALAVGTVTVLTVHPQPAFADCQGSSGC